MADDADSQPEDPGNEMARLNRFQLEIQQVTNFVKDHDKSTNHEEKQEEDEAISIAFTPSMASTSELSVSYSSISDEVSYIHGAAFSSPKVSFHESAIPTVVEIHNLLTSRHHTLFFVPEPDSSSDSEQNTENKEKTIKNTKKKKLCKKKRCSKRNALKKSLSERGLTFAISEGHVYFNWSAFIREYIYNFFHFLILPIILLNENKSGARSRLYWPCDWNFYGYFIFFQVLGFFYMNILYFGYFEHVSGCAMTLLVYDVLYLLRIAVIAIKWGYLPPQIFEMMRKKKLTQEQFNMIHLLTGWVNHENKTGLAREIGQCCARLELNINELKFAFRDERVQKSKSKNLCLRRRCSTYVTYGNLLIPYIVFCASRHLSKWSVITKKMFLIISPIISICPLMNRILSFSSFSEAQSELNIHGIVWYLIAFITNTSNLYTLLLFSAVIALDFKRRFQFVRFCTRLIELKKDAFGGLVDVNDYKQHLFPNCTGTKEKRKELKDAIIQTLDLSDEETMYNWSKLRAFFLDFGLRFLRREEAILGYFTLSMFLVVGCYITVLYLDILEISEWEMASLILSSVAVMTPAFYALRYATRINQKVTEQRYILADKRLRLENERLHRLGDIVGSKSSNDGNKEEHAEDVGGDKEEDGVDNNHFNEVSAESIARASNMLDKIVKMLEVDRFRIRLLGYTVDTTVTGIIAAVVGTVGFLVARLLLGEDAEGIPDT